MEREATGPGERERTQSKVSCQHSLYPQATEAGRSEHWAQVWGARREHWQEGLDPRTEPEAGGLLGKEVAPGPGWKRGSL